MTLIIKPRERAAIIQSLQAGVVPRVGLQHIQVGRKDEVAAILKDLDLIEQGGSSIRFIIGRFGSGKTFFLNLMRTIALEKKFVVVQADITTDRRLQSTGGQARGLYAELMRNLSTKAKPEGGALQSVIERWISGIDHEVRQSGEGSEKVETKIHRRLVPLQDFVSGYDFSTVLAQYFKGHQTGDEGLRQSALRWLRAEYTTKTEARGDLGVRTIIDDAQIYDYLKLMGSFVHLAGYGGLLVNVDEMGVLSHRLSSAQARNANYEAILRILNDCLQGGVNRLGFLFGGTDEFLEDRRRGLFSYEALATRLASNIFAGQGIKDLSGPVVRLNNLTPEDLYVLLINIRRVFASGDEACFLIPDNALEAFMMYCAKRLGDAYFKTPRDTVKGFVNLLSALEQNPGRDWRELLNTSVEQIQQAANDEETEEVDLGLEDNLLKFKLK